MSELGSPVPAPQQEPPAIEHHVLEGFTEAVAKMVLTVESFAKGIQEAEVAREESRRHNRRVAMLVGALVFALTLVGAVGIVRLNVFSQGNRTNIRVNQDNSAIIRDCVVPGGVCFQRNQANLAQAVKQANDADANGKIDSKEILEKLDEIEANQRR